MMTSPILLVLLNTVTPSSQAADFQSTVRSLLSCAYDATTTLEGRRFKYKWATPNRDSDFVASCSDPGADRNQIFFYSQNSVSEFSFLEPKAYKGGMEQPLYRLKYNGETRYFREDIMGGLDSLFDQNGSALYPVTDAESQKIDISAKNLALTYYMQQVAGKANANGSLTVGPLKSDQEALARSCLITNVKWLVNNLFNLFNGQAGRGTSTSDLITMQTKIVAILGQESCNADPSLKAYIEKVLRVTDLIANGRVTIVNKRTGTSFSTQYTGAQADIDLYRQLLDEMNN